MGLLKSTKLVAFLILISIVTGCGGSGGSDGGGEGRTSGTGVRIIHSGLDLEPIEITIDGEVSTPEQKNFAKYLEATTFFQVDEGTHLIRITRKGEPTISYYQQNLSFDEDTEYTLFPTGRISEDNFRINLVAEKVTRPESGFSKVNILNALDGTLQLQIGAGSVESKLAGISEDLFVPAGVSTYLIKRNGKTIASGQFNFKDRGDTTLLISGASNLGAVFTKILEDLD